MIDKLNIALIEYDLVWKKENINFQTVQNAVNQIPENTHLILLPEMFNTGFITEKNDMKLYAQSMKGNSVKFLKEIATSRKCWIMGTVLIEEGHKFYNRMLVLGPEKQMYTYDKRHLFSYGGEHEYIEKGKQRKIVEIEGWKIHLGICYDLRFPVFSRNQNDYDVAVYLSNWPASRNLAWNTLLAARAIENQAYVVGVNIKGKSESGLSYTGGSNCFSPDGNKIGLQKIGYIESQLSKKFLTDFRLKYPFLHDADAFKLL